MLLRIDSRNVGRVENLEVNWKEKGLMLLHIRYRYRIAGAAVVRGYTMEWVRVRPSKTNRGTGGGTRGSCVAFIECVVDRDPALFVTVDPWNKAERGLG